MFRQFSHKHPPVWQFFFFFKVTASTVIYTLSLHDALPICGTCGCEREAARRLSRRVRRNRSPLSSRSEEHTSELQSRRDLVCRLLLEKKKGRINYQCC